MAAQSDFGTRWPRLVILALALCGLGACTEPAPHEEASAPPQAKAENADKATDTLASPGLSAERMAQWSRSCALCHVRGEGGAPVLGDREAWAERSAQGEAMLLEHTVAGLNNMPPLGYCMDCEEDDFLALIRFMGGEQ